MEISTLMNKICILKPTLEMYVLRYPLDANDADQLVQDTLIKALLEADSYSETLTLKHWLLSLMKDKYNESYLLQTESSKLLNPKRKAVPMRVVHNGLKDGITPPIFSKEALHKMLLDKLDEFDADLIDHEQQFSLQATNIKEA